MGLEMRKDEVIGLIREAFEEVSIYIGTTALRMIVERILYDLSVYNSSLRSIKVEDPKEIDFYKFSPNELKKFYYMFADIIGTMLGDEFKEELLKSWKEGKVNVKT